MCARSRLCGRPHAKRSFRIARKRWPISTATSRSTERIASTSLNRWCWRGFCKLPNSACRAALKDCGLSNVTVTAGEAGKGNAASGPYDVIVLDGATEVVPQALYDQLKLGGRLVGVFAHAVPSRATIVTRSVADFGPRTLFDATAPILSGLKRLPAFTF